VLYEILLGVGRFDPARAGLKSHVGGFSLSEMSFLLGRSLSSQRRDSRRQLQPLFSSGQSSHPTVTHQVANAGARTKGSIFEIVYRRMVPRLGHNQTIGHCSSTVPSDLADPA